MQLQLKTAARARLKKSGSYGRAEFQAFMREVVEILFTAEYAGDGNLDGSTSSGH